jgi:LmbE family N-acetylglucosaminyl deacetylase
VNWRTGLAPALALALLALPAVDTHAQAAAVRSATDIEIALEKLNTLGSVLYLAAHPDDENTAVLAYLSKGRKYRTAYLSLTRGDGGQNLIGTEKGVEIGILRTQELLAARRIDGAEQYFTRAIDFGYSKTAQETYEFWGKEQTLSDVVWVIRKFRPDIIVTRFPPGASGGHGNHTASAQLALEAFHAAANPARFPEQLRYVETWQARRLFWNGFGRGEQQSGPTIRSDVGEFYPLLGESYPEIAARSRSMHKTQGFGSAGARGERYETFSLVEGDTPSGDLLDGIETTWNRVPGGVAVGRMLDAIIAAFDPREPAASVPALLQMYDEMGQLEKDVWVEQKRSELLELIRSCAGLWMEAISEDYAFSPGDSLTVRATVVNRSDFPFTLESFGVTTGAADTAIGAVLENNHPVVLERTLLIPGDFPVSQPYWLRAEPSPGAFAIPDLQMVGLAENPPPVGAVFTLRSGARRLEYNVPLLHRWTDRVDGELYRQLEIRPPVTLNLDDKVAVFTTNTPRMVTVRLKGQTAGVSGQIRLTGPTGWRFSPAAIPFTLADKYAERLADFQVFSPVDENGAASEAVLIAEATVDGRFYRGGLVEITYPHIGTESYFPEARIFAVQVPMDRPEGQIGYVMGAGDEIPADLRNLGYDVVEFDDLLLESADLSQYDAIITGVRAYNTRDRLPYARSRLMEYVRGGGTLIVQYNVTSGLLAKDIGPYPFTIGRERITDETAGISFVDSGHQLLHFPNEITEKDFEGWVQERGLYFASQWDNSYEPILSGHDPGESNLAGGLLFARYGEGVFIYTGYSWFRQLPAGVPGAYRLFVNMISAGKYDGG